MSPDATPEVTVKDIRDMTLAEYAKFRNQVGIPDSGPGWMSASTRRSITGTSFLSAPVARIAYRPSELEQWNHARWKYSQSGHQSHLEEMLSHVRLEDAEAHVEAINA